MKLNIAFAALLACSAAIAADVKVIANPAVQVSSMSEDELKRVFLGTKTSLSDGTKVEPVLAKGGPAHEAFLKTYLGKTDAALSTWYRSQVFTGKASMPKILANDSEIAAYVAKTKGAIGYVGASAPTGELRRIEVK